MLDQTAPTEAPVAQPPVGPEGSIGLTAKAIEVVQSTRDQENLGEKCGLRVAVRGGGCSGFEYALDFDPERRDTDEVIEYEGLSVFVDPISARYLNGTLIDYITGMMGAGFKFHNPNASGTCGCGSSFAV